MTSASKRKWYRAIDLICLIAAVAATVVFVCFVLHIEYYVTRFTVLAVAAFVLLVFPLNDAVHEGGHLLFGLCAGLKFSALQISFFRIFREGKRLRFQAMKKRAVAGACAMFPNSGKNVRGRMIAFSLGGAVCNLIYGVVFVALFFCLPHDPALLFFEVFAPLSLYEGIVSAVPAELPAGKTDGEAVLGLFKNSPAADLSLRVFTAQGLLNGTTFENLPPELFEDAPVVREDDIAFIAWTQLRWQYYFSLREDQKAVLCLKRLESLYEYVSEEYRAQIACDLVYGNSYFLLDPVAAKKFLADAERAKGGNAKCAFAAYRWVNEVWERGGEISFDEAEQAAEEEPIFGISQLYRDQIARLR